MWMEKIQPVRHYRDLVAWQKAMNLVELEYKATKSWPKDELYGLTSQIRRAVVSVPSNIAEGQGRGSTKEFLHHLSIARGSLLEVETQAIIAQRLGYLPGDAAESVLANADEVSRVISGLSRSLADR
jgi:four helix bundle protein